jgi:NAD(P)-dependent dehydrogenase (short-subunit alcohol dehydrogenase family)
MTSTTLVTGTSSGLGQEAALQFADQRDRCDGLRVRSAGSKNS